MSPLFLSKVPVNEPLYVPFYRASMERAACLQGLFYISLNFLIKITPLSAVNCKLPWGLTWKLLRVCTIVCVILFVPYSLCLPQQNNETIIPKICGLRASYQWLLYIHPDVMVTFTSTCHVLSNLYTSFPILWDVWPKNVSMTYGVICTHRSMCVCVCVLMCFQVGDLLFYLLQKVAWT